MARSAARAGTGSRSICGRCSTALMPMRSGTRTRPRLNCGPRSADGSVTIRADNRPSLHLHRTSRPHEPDGAGPPRPAPSTQTGRADAPDPAPASVLPLHDPTPQELAIRSAGRRSEPLQGGSHPLIARGRAGRGESQELSSRGTPPPGPSEPTATGPNTRHQKRQADWTPIEADQTPMNETGSLPSP